MNRASDVGAAAVCISGLATYVPPRLLTNADLERMVDTNDEWILQRTGIRERHIVDPGVATSDLGQGSRDSTPSRRPASPPPTSGSSSSARPRRT